MAVVLPIEGLMKVSAGLGYPNVDRTLDNDGHLRRIVLFDDRMLDVTGGDRPNHSMDVASYSLFTGVPIEEVQRRWGMPLSRELLLNFRGPRIWQRHPIQYERQAAGAMVSVEQLTDIESPYRVARRSMS